jgi:outer membrane protein OmpA-like peptidoglycan-associated protein
MFLYLFLNRNTKIYEHSFFQNVPFYNLYYSFFKKSILKQKLLLSIVLLLTLSATISQAQVNSVTYKLKNYTLFTDNSGANKPNDDILQGVEIGYAHGLNKYLDLYVPMRLGVPIFKSGNIIQQGSLGFDPSIVGKYDNGGKIVPYASLGFSGENIANTWNWGTLVGGGLNFRIADNTFLNVGTGFRRSFTAQRNSWQHSLGLIMPVGGAGLDAEPKISAKQQAINDAAAARLAAEAAAKAQAEAALKAAADAAAAEKAKMEAEAQAQAEKLRMEAEAKIKAEKEKVRMEAEARAQAEKAQLEAEARKKAAVTPPPTVVTTTTTTTQAPVVLTQKEQEVMTYAMQGVQFETGSAQLVKSSYTVLDNVVSVLKGNSQLRLSINGHTDRTGNESANVKLSQSRANACMAYLVSKGISLSRLTAKGYGSSQPVSDNSTAEGRKMNRRVEFTSY